MDGDLWFECRMLMESCRFYDLQRVAEIACDKSAFVTAPAPRRVLQTT